MLQRDHGDDADHCRRDLVLEAVEELIDEASGSPVIDDRTRLEDLLALRGRLLAEPDRDSKTAGFDE